MIRSNYRAKRRAGIARYRRPDQAQPIIEADLEEFLSNYCHTGADEAVRCYYLYSAYEYYTVHRLGHKHLGKKTFTARVADRPGISKVQKSGDTYFTGIRIKETLWQTG